MAVTPHEESGFVGRVTIATRASADEIEIAVTLEEQPARFGGPTVAGSSVGPSTTQTQDLATTPPVPVATLTAPVPLPAPTTPVPLPVGYGVLRHAVSAPWVRTVGHSLLIAVCLIGGALYVAQVVAILGEAA